MLRIASTALLVLGLASPLAAQPDFSGTWVLNPARSESARAIDATTISSATLTITQNDREVHIDTVRNGLPQEVRYASAADALISDAGRHLISDAEPRAVGTSGATSDEPPSAVGTSGRDRASEAVPSIIGTTRRDVTTTWEGDTMVTLTAYQVNGQTVTTTERRTLSADGREMTVVTQLQVQHGYSAGPNASRPLTDVYVREQP
jgi:hypothetical protein